MQEIVQICLHFIWSIQIKIIFLHPQTKGNDFTFLRGFFCLEENFQHQSTSVVRMLIKI